MQGVGSDDLVALDVGRSVREGELVRPLSLPKRTTDPSRYVSTRDGGCTPTGAWIVTYLMSGVDPLS